ncbi:cellulase family glycosylhydrolase [Sphingomonas sp. BAUL-RG-20F-R05-02]|uniref:cellulase family glycosylhydrolase n=1 Tax=Sphingomonas sp. BAUL-RG-20F-R05-02 TaxID=2914830 RepID=UPI001F55C79B|nr:cellulase family glycosylhydrolase [Sphingomonas sp. BAUL-RG-20F-R05-02]
MSRYVLAAVLALLAMPALADTVPLVDGPLIVRQGDIVVSSKPLVQATAIDTLTCFNSVCVNRMTGHQTILSGGATKLKALGPIKGGYVLNGYRYQVMDGAPAASTPPAPVLTSQPAPTVSGPLYGINVSGGEFANMDNGQSLPTPADLDAYYAVGYRMFRIPLKFVQFDNSAPKLNALANECIKLATPCVFENHSYAWPAPALQVAQVVKADSVLPKSSLIQYGLQNEPNFKDWDQWAKDAQAIVTGVRAAGVTRFLWLDYPGSSGAQRFDKGDRAPKACASVACSMAKLPSGTIVDPLHRTGLDIHRYFDSNGSGTSMNCDKWVILASAARAAVPFGMPVLYGEYAFGNDGAVKDTCAALAPSIMQEIKDSPNLYGVTLWGGGSRWGNYMFRALPKATSPYIKMTTGQ